MTRLTRDEMAATMDAWDFSVGVHTPPPSQEEGMTNPFRHMKPLGHYLLDEIAAGRIDFHIRAEHLRAEVFGGEQDLVVFYIHPQGKDGDTQNYFIANAENPDLVFKGSPRAAATPEEK